MTNCRRCLVVLLLILSVLAPSAVQSRAQSAPFDGAGCWPSSAISTDASGHITFDQPPAMAIDPTLGYGATISTSLGDIELSLFTAEVPETVNNFACLAALGFYDGTNFSRIIPGFIAQGGDQGATGYGDPGYTFPTEPFTTPYRKGVIAMANSGPDSNGSQFFITLADVDGEFSPTFPVFGELTSGQEVIDAIGAVEVAPNDYGEVSRPVEPVVIDSITIHEGLPVEGLPTPLASPDAPVVDSAPTPPNPLGPAGEPSVAGLAAAGTLSVQAGTISPASIDVPSSRPVTLTFVNGDEDQHIITIDALRVRVVLEAGATESVTLFIPPGVYRVHCSGARHEGEVAQVVARPANPTENGNALFTPVSVPAAPPAATAQVGCDGFEAYQAAYDDAIYGSMMENPDILDAATALSESEDFSDITDEQFRAIGGWYRASQLALAQVEPPSWAQAWHDATVESLGILADVFFAAAADGADAAFLAHSAALDRNTTELTAAAEAATLSCPDFEAWAADSG